jgi:tetratricopeptide (TPR) repeat protein
MHKHVIERRKKKQPLFALLSFFFLNYKPFYWCYMATNSDVDLEIFTLIWLDASINESENKNTQTELRKLSDRFQPFDNCDECKSFIQSISIDECIVLIVSGRLGREIVPHIHSIEQIHSIYVYCFDRQSNELWAQDYSKIQQVVTTPIELIERIRHDNQRKISPATNESLYINIYQGNLDDQFIQFQLLINHFLQMKIYSTINSQLFTLYQNDNLQEFQENYSSENCLWWFTKDLFLSKLISQFFHTKNIDLLYLTRFYLRDINEQLEYHQPSTLIHVYHSHLMSNEEIEQLKTSIGKLISINTFLMTTSQRTTALLALKQPTDLQKILFEIDADPSMIGMKSFADITSISYFKNQSQILFMLGSIFRINNFFQQDHIWICQMTLSNENDSELETIFEHFEKEDGNYSTDLLSFGNMLARMNQYDDAEKYYQHILKEYSSNDQITHVCYRNLGNIAYLKKDYDQSLRYHLQSLEIKQNLFQSNHPDLADNYNCLGIVYFDKNDYDQAIDNYEKTLKILELNFDDNYNKIIICLNNISLVYRMKENYSQALDYYLKILNLQQRYSFEDLGQTYHNLGALYWCLGFDEQAIKYYILSLEMKYKHLRSNHSSIAMTLENLGLIYENKNDFHQALEYYRKASEIYQETHFDMKQIDENILRVSIELNKI